MFVGFLTHLILDEMYSVDVYDTRIKASFGTALKFYDGKRLGESGCGGGVGGAGLHGDAAVEAVRRWHHVAQLWAGLHNRLLPRQHWFGIDIEQQRARRRIAGQRAAADVTTGSIKPTADKAP